MTFADPGSSVTQPLRILPARAEDVDTIVDILEEGARWLADLGIEQWPVGVFSALPNLIADGITAGQFYLAFVDLTPVGTARLQWSDNAMWPEARDDEAGYVHSLAVRRAWSGRGIGREILRWCQTQVIAVGREYLRLDCVAHNKRLIRYYVEAGFARRGTVASRWGDASTTHQRFEKRAASY